MQYVARSGNKQSVAFRFDGELLAALRRRAAESGAAQTELAERYIGEGLRLDQHPSIYFRDGEAGRRAALLGSRLDVAQVIATVRQNGNSIEAAAEYLEIPVEHVDAAVRYYADFKEEVDSWAERTEALAQRERERQRRRDDALA